MKYNLELWKLKAELCRTFSDSTRLMIINELREGEKQVGDLAQTLQIAQAMVSRHPAILRERGIAITRREGTKVYYSLSNPRICEACDLIHEILLKQIEKNKELAERLIP